MGIYTKLVLPCRMLEPPGKKPEENAQNQL